MNETHPWFESDSTEQHTEYTGRYTIRHLEWVEVVDCSGITHAVESIVVGDFRFSPTRFINMNLYSLGSMLRVRLRRVELRRGGTEWLMMSIQDSGG